MSISPSHHADILPDGLCLRPSLFGSKASEGRRCGYGCWHTGNLSFKKRQFCELPHISWNESQEKTEPESIFWRLILVKMIILTDTSPYFRNNEYTFGAEIQDLKRNRGRPILNLIASRRATKILLPAIIAARVTSRFRLNSAINNRDPPHKTVA